MKKSGEITHLLDVLGVGQRCSGRILIILVLDLRGYVFVSLLAIQETERNRVISYLLTYDT